MSVSELCGLQAEPAGGLLPAEETSTERAAQQAEDQTGRYSGELDTELDTDTIIHDSFPD